MVGPTLTGANYGLHAVESWWRRLPVRFTRARAHVSLLPLPTKKADIEQSDTANETGKQTADEGITTSREALDMLEAADLG